MNFTSRSTAMLPRFRCRRNETITVFYWAGMSDIHTRCHCAPVWTVWFVVSYIVFHVVAPDILQLLNDQPDLQDPEVRDDSRAQMNARVQRPDAALYENLYWACGYVNSQENSLTPECAKYLLSSSPALLPGPNNCIPAVSYLSLVFWQLWWLCCHRQGHNQPQWELATASAVAVQTNACCKEGPKAPPYTARCIKLQAVTTGFNTPSCELLQREAWHVFFHIFFVTGVVTSGR